MKCARCGSGHGEVLDSRFGRVCFRCYHAAIPDAQAPPAADRQSPEAEVREHGADRSTWAPVDLGPTLAGEADLEPPPAMLPRTDGVGLVYRAKTHLLFGEPETGKGWIALEIVRERLAAGEHVLYIDFDDQDRAVIVSRLRALGVDDEAIGERFHYVIPDEPLDDAGRAEIEQLLDQHAPTLAVLDGFTDALALHSVNDKDNSEIATWMRGLPSMLRRRGLAVVLIDHVVKDRERRRGYSIGAQHKRAKVDVSYELIARDPLGRGLTGRSRIKLRKDRPGHVRRHVRYEAVAEMIGESLPGDSMEIALRPPSDQPLKKRLTGYMEKVSLAVEGSEPEGLNVGAIRDLVAGNNDRKDSARADLVAEGFLFVEPKGREMIHHSLRPFRETADEGTEGAD